MLVTKINFREVLELLKLQPVLGFDTETTCLNWWKSPWYSIEPRVFAMQFANEHAEFYFDWHYHPDKLDDSHFKILNDELFSNPETLWFIQNAKFDMHHCKNHGIDFAGSVHCTKAIARVMNNMEPGLKLDDLSKIYLGAGKFLDMAAQCKELGHFTTIKKFGHNDKTEDILHFDRIDFATMVEYGKIDTRRCFDLGVYQVRKILELTKQMAVTAKATAKLSNVLYNEYAVTKVCFQMEREGVLIDRAYTEEAYEYEVKQYKTIEGELDGLAQAHIPNKIDWNAPKQLKLLFDALKEPYGFTEKGNACFDHDALEDSESQVAKLILKYRYHYKRAHTYFENLIWLSDVDNVVHADAQQAGTKFGRMSYWQPNLQNIPKRRDKDEAKYPVRKCFIARPGTLLVDIDYTGAEYYMAMDYANEEKIINELITGLDPHARLATEMNIKGGRDPAKTMQFRILYGGGGGVIGRALGYKGDEAVKVGKKAKKEYFSRVPNLAYTMRQVSAVAAQRGFIFNWLGRKLDYDGNTSYKAFNGLIQSGVGDMTKKAMVEVAKTIENTDIKMLIQVHDALLFQIPYADLPHVSEIIRVMTTVYPHKKLPMKAEAGYSATSWAALQDEPPSVP